MAHIVTQFEPLGKNVTILKGFYSSPFGWKISRTDVPVPEGMDYHTAETGPIDEKGNLVRDGVCCNI